MKRYKYLSLLIILLIIFVTISQGCSQQAVDANAKQSGNQKSGISKDDLAMVNEYLKGIGSKEISLDAVEDINHSINENTQTHEIKSDWQFLVEYIRNEKSAEPAILDYSFEFCEDTFTMRIDNIWEKIAR